MNNRYKKALDEGVFFLGEIYMQPKGIWPLQNKKLKLLKKSEKIYQ